MSDTRIERHCFPASDPSKIAIVEYEVSILKRRDRLGNQSGGFDVRRAQPNLLKIQEGGHEITLCFQQAVYRRLLEAACESAGGFATWGLRVEGQQ